MQKLQSTNATSVQELIPISEQNGKRAVSARDLHIFLESKRDFSNWMKDRIKKYGLIENHDFVRFNKNVESLGGRSIEYALTIDCAKELAMVEGNAKGKLARQYFIECEQRLKEVTKPLSTLDLLELTIKGMRENNLELQEIKKDVLELKARTITRPEEFTIAGYATLNGMCVNLSQASKFGRMAKALCRNRNVTPGIIPDPRFGKVHTYPKTVLEEVFSQPIN